MQKKYSLYLLCPLRKVDYFYLHCFAVEIIVYVLQFFHFIKIANYFKSGLFGCGGAIAHGVARTGLGDSLLNATRTMTVHELRSYLPIWRNELKFELANNPGGYLKCQYETLSKQISDEFPDIATLHSYAFPVVSSFTNLDRSQWVSRNINIRSLTRLCEQSFSWGTVTGISKKFINVLWKGVAFQQLLEVWTISNIFSSKVQNNIHSSPTWESMMRL
jgi:hypothetical protein